MTDDINLNAKWGTWEVTHTLRYFTSKCKFSGIVNASTDYQAMVCQTL